MQEQEFYKEIESYIKRNEINKKTRISEENYDTLNNYWQIGKLLVEAQGGEARARYGNELIKKWSIEFTKTYGKGYDESNLKRFRKLFIVFPKGATLWHLSWSQLKILLPIKDESERNYYINLCIENNMSVRELIKEIKSNSYERLINKPKHIEIIKPKDNYSLLGKTKNPIIIEVGKGKKINNEKDLEITILSQLKSFFKELGEGFTFMDNQYKITYNNKNYFIDILLFNYKLNCFVVVELKVRELRKEDKAQIEFYMELIDKQIKEPIHNKTIGIIITKEQNKLIVNFIQKENIIPLTYKLENK